MLNLPEGAKLYLVGGAVRDNLRGMNPHDKDYMITGADPDELPFEKVAGSDFPVFIVEIDGVKCEVALARAEEKVGVGHKGFVFKTGKDVTVEEDLKRRDLTINAMAVDLESSLLIDPYGGQEDIKNRILRHVSPAFAEDPLRVLRVARFAAHFGYTIAPETLELMRSLKDELTSLSAERVWQETAKALMLPRPSKYFKVLDYVDALEVLFPEIKALQVPDKHDGTAFNHTMNLIDIGCNMKNTFALLTHDFGKGATDPEKHPAHIMHEHFGPDIVRSFCERLKVPNELRDFGALCAKEHMRAKCALQMKDKTFVKWVLGLGDNFNDAFYISYYDSRYREGADVEEENAKKLLVAKRAQRVFEAAKKVTGQTLIDEGCALTGKEFGNELMRRRIQAFRREE